MRNSKENLGVVYTLPYYKISTFKKVCEIIGGLNKKEIKELVEGIIESNDNKNDYRYDYAPEFLFENFVNNEKCRAIVEKQRYRYWEQLVERMWEIEDTYLYTDANNRSRR